MTLWAQDCWAVGARKNLRYGEHLQGSWALTGRQMGIFREPNSICPAVKDSPNRVARYLVNMPFDDLKPPSSS